MADYKEETLTGNKWRRCYQVIINNPAPGYGSPNIVFIEQEVLSLGGDTILKQVGNVSVNFDPAASINVFDPVTLEPTGTTFTHMDLYGMLFSAYMTAAKERDLAENPPA